MSWLLPGLLAPFLIGNRLPRWWAPGGITVMFTGTSVITLVTPAEHRSTAGILPGLVIGLLSWIGGPHRRLPTGRGSTNLVERDQDQARVALNALVFVADGTLTQVGRSLTGLAHRRLPDQLDPAALDVLAGIVHALGLQVDIAVIGQLPQVRDETAQAVYLIVREALANTARHATAAAVRVCITVDGATLEIRVTDTGPPVPPAQRVDAVTGSGRGLRGMREGVEALRGDITAGPSQHGFEILTRLPS